MLLRNSPSPAATLIIEVSDSGRIQKWNDREREIEESSVVSIPNSQTARARFSKLKWPSVSTGE
jgi:hypothetical protein